MAQFGHDSQSLSVGVVSETNVGMAGFNNRTELGHGLWRWFRPVWKRAVWIIINRQDFAAEFRQPTRNESGTSTITTIDRNRQATRLNGGDVKGICQQFDMV